MKIGRFGTILVFVTSYVRLCDASIKLVEHFSDIEFLQSSHLEITVLSVRMKWSIWKTRKCHSVGCSHLGRSEPNKFWTHFWNFYWRQNRSFSYTWRWLCLDCKADTARIAKLFAWTPWNKPCIFQEQYKFIYDTLEEYCRGIDSRFPVSDLANKIKEKTLKDKKIKKNAYASEYAVRAARPVTEFPLLYFEFVHITYLDYMRSLCLILWTDF